MINKNGWVDINKSAKNEGYRLSSSGDSWIKSDGSKIKPTPSGGSVNVNGHVYTSASDAKRSGRI